MVVFTCNHCGESVKKPVVEKHYNTKCRGAKINVSCMDCLKDFYGEEYVAHIKCITEAQKYSGKDYVHKESNNSNAKKQESWMDIVRSILESSEYNLSAKARKDLEKLQSVDNVPRKKAKFLNFTSNCMRLAKPQAAELWSVLEKELEKMKQAKVQQTTAAKVEKQEQKVNGAVKRENTEQHDHIEIPKKKSKLENGVAEAQAASDQASNGVESQEFVWDPVFIKIISKKSAGIDLDKLKKKVLKKYIASLGVDELTEKQQKKFGKKFLKNLQKCTKVQVNGNVAMVC